MTVQVYASEHPWIITVAPKAGMASTRLCWSETDAISAVIDELGKTSPPPADIEFTGPDSIKVALEACGYTISSGTRIKGSAA